MKNETEIFSRLKELQEKIAVLEQKKNTELEKKYNQRDIRLLIFLNKECSIYSLAASQLEWLLSE